MNQLLDKARYFHLNVSIVAKNANEMWIFYPQFVGKFDTPKNLKLAKVYSLKFMYKWPYLYQYLTDSNK